MEIESARLRILQPCGVNAAARTAYVQRNRSFLAATSPLRDEYFYTEEGQAALLKEQEELMTQGRAAWFYIAPKAGPDRMIGFVALNNIVRGAFLSCHLGYQLDLEYVNLGFMTEAVTAVCNYAFDTLMLHRIEANIMPRNLPSRRVAEKCGFHEEGLAKKYLRINGAWEDHIHYVRLNGALETDTL